MKFEQETNNLPPYHKVWVRIGTLEVMFPGPVTAIPCPHVNYTRMTTHALRPVIILRWKEAAVPPPIGLTISGRSFATRSPAT
jgi:hypothetical protein